MTNEEKRIKELENELDRKNQVIETQKSIINGYEFMIKELCVTLRKNLEVYAPHDPINRDTIERLKQIENSMENRIENDKGKE